MTINIDYRLIKLPYIKLINTTNALLIDEEVDKILNHISSKLPPEVLNKVDVMDGVKEKLHNYYNMSFQNMFNRYLTTAEDEMTKKYRDLISMEEYKGLHRYTPRLISSILESIGGIDKFNVGELDKSIVNIYGHLQGSIQRSLYTLETETNSILRQKTDVGAFVRGENTYSIAKCSIKDNGDKPTTVSDLKMAINILDSELISAILHLHKNPSVLLQTIASDEIMIYLEEEIKKINSALLDEGKLELEDNESTLKKIQLLENYVGDDKTSETSSRYQLVAKHILDAVDRVLMGTEEKNILSVRYNVQKILEIEGVHNRGYNTAVNTLTNVLDTSKMSYQNIENSKGARVCRISEYTDKDNDQLPDERYAMSLSYYDTDQIEAMRQAYNKQFLEFQEGFEEALFVIEKRYLEYKNEKKIIDYSDILADMENSEQKAARAASAEENKGSFLSRFLKSDSPQVEEKTEEQEDDFEGSVWNEFIFLKPGENDNINPYNKYDADIREIREKLVHMNSRLTQIYSRHFPEYRVIIEERVSKLVKDFNHFVSQVNPYQLQPGICLEIDITSIKRKKTTIMTMANVLNEFLHSVSKGFSDSAFANFQRRRSSVRDDIDREFTLSPDGMEG